MSLAQVSPTTRAIVSSNNTTSKDGLSSYLYVTQQLRSPANVRAEDSCLGLVRTAAQSRLTQQRGLNASRVFARLSQKARPALRDRVSSIKGLDADQSPNEQSADSCPAQVDEAFPRQVAKYKQRARAARSSNTQTDSRQSLAGINAKFEVTDVANE
jgi:hypothetical protein